MKNWKHLDIQNRKTISSCISHNYKLINISKILEYDSRAISREVKRNRIPVDFPDATSSNCPKLNVVLMFVQIVSLGIKIVLLLNLNMTLKLLKEKLMLI